MFGGVIEDTGVALFGVSACILAAALWLLVWRRGFKQVHAQLKDMSVTLEGVDRQVNQTPKGEPTLRDLVSTIASDVESLHDKVDDLGGQVAKSAARIKRLEEGS